MDTDRREPRELAAGTVITDRYLLVSRVAGGGMGEVWKAEDTVLGRMVAIKFLRDEFADDVQFRERLRREARSAGAISHPSVVPVYDYGEVARENAPYLAFIVMEFIDGPSLSTELSQGPLSPERTLLIIEQTAGALQAAHDAGIVHRDIKPANILVTATGDVKLTDFGISHAADAVPLTRTGVLTGTAKYFSPEQAGGQRATEASDIYSLGVVAYACLTGEVPFGEGNDISIALAHIRQRPSELPYDVPDGLRDLVMAMLEKDPADRPASASAVARIATGLLRSVPDAPDVSEAPHPFAPPRPTPSDDQTLVAEQTLIGLTPVPQRRRHRSRWKVIAAAVAVVLIGAVILVRSLAGGATVPSVIGDDRAAAVATMKGAGLDPTVSLKDAVGKRAGVVITQSLAPGADVGDNVRVVLTVASGKVRVPTTLTGLAYDDAVAILAKAGLTAKRATATSLEAAGTVIDVSPTGRVADGSTVTLTVAVAPAPTKPTLGKGKGGKGKH